MAALLAGLTFKRCALGAYLDDLAKSPWAWGRMDCTTAVADWIWNVHGIDVMAPWRGKYASGKEAIKLAKTQGGFVPNVGRLLDEAGFERTQSPEDGDIALLDIPRTGRVRMMPVVGAVMGIRLKRWWIAKAQSGIVADDWSFIHAWRL